MSAPSMSVEGDHELVYLARRGLAGDKTAEAEFVRRVYRNVQENIRRAELLRTQYMQGESGSDLVQVTVADAWKDLKDFCGETDTQLLAWVNRILRNNLANQRKKLFALRRDIRRRRALSEEDAAQLAAPHHAPDEHAAENELLQLLRTGMVRLPERCRRLLQLRLAGWTFAEIGASEGVSAGAVRAACLRVESRLRRSISPPPLNPGVRLRS